MGSKNDQRDTSEATKRKKIQNRATRLKAENQKATRERLQSQGHIQHVLEISKQLQEKYEFLESSQVAALKAAADIKLRIINKFQPDLKSVEVSQDPENPLFELTDDQIMEKIKAINIDLEGDD